MRISTSSLFDQNVTAMLNQQSKLGETQLQVSTGKKILNPSDDPAGSVQILNLQREFSITKQYLANADKAENKQTIEEGVLSSATDILQRVKELSVQGLSDTHSQSERQAIALEINQLNEQLLSLANTRDSNGDYVFSGFKSNTQPYENINGVYQGDQGQRSVKVGDGVLIETNDVGSHVFEANHIATTTTKTGSGVGSTSNIAISAANGVQLSTPLSFSFNGAIAPSGGYDVTDGVTSATIAYSSADSGKIVDLSVLNPALPKISVKLTGAPVASDSFTIATNTSNQTLFAAIDKFSNALEANQVGANNSPNNGDFLTNLSASMDKVLITQSKIGSRINAIDQQRQVNQGISFNNEKILSDIQDLDYSKAISQLSIQMTGLQAAQQSFAKVQGLSLFNFL